MVFKISDQQDSRTLDSLRDLHRERERGRRLKSRNLRLSPCACAFDERHELLLQRFLAINRNFVARDLAAFAPIDFAALFFVIEREISVFLKNTDLAHPLGADPAGSHVRDTTIFETN